ncbi:hypothetical protein [Kitasatospora sp. NPDC017646]|uniref:hypothetical protein n=1 Tax=Kitasatospora sp. NPDC017646 TaxID=3364024 RepID=UPI0037B437E8
MRQTRSAIDTAINNVVATIPVGTRPFGVAVTPDGRHAYVTNEGSDNLSVINTATNAVTTNIQVDVAPSGIAITPDGTRAYVGTDGPVDVIDTTTTTVSGTVATNGATVGVAIALDGTHAYVAAPGGPRAVDVIDMTTNAVTTTVPVGNSPQQGAITPASRPSLTITKTHTATFVPGRQGTYTITVGNNGTAPTDGTIVRVQDTLPAGLTAVRLVGSGWNCVRSTLTCTRSDVLNLGSTYPPITLWVRVSRTATGTLTNTATVSGGGNGTATSTDPTTITPPVTGTTATTTAGRTATTTAEDTRTRPTTTATTARDSDRKARAAPLERRAGVSGRAAASAKAATLTHPAIHVEQGAQDREVTVEQEHWHLRAASRKPGPRTTSGARAARARPPIRLTFPRFGLSWSEAGASHWLAG